MLKTTSSFDRFTPLSTLIKSGDYSEKDIGTAVIMRASNATAEFKNDVWQLVELFEDLKKWDAWKYTGRKSLEEFCSEFFGRTVDAVQKLGRTVHEMKERGLVDFRAESVERYANLVDYAPAAAKRGRPNDDEKEGNTRFMGEHNNAEGIIRRLKRDEHQAELDAIASGEMTPNQAALAVGYRKPRCSVRTDDIQSAIDTLLKHYDLDALRDEVNLR